MPGVRILPTSWLLPYSYHHSGNCGLFRSTRNLDRLLIQKDAAMNYRAIIIGLGLLIFLAAMIPYAYKTRCSSPSECPTTAPY